MTPHGALGDELGRIARGIARVCEDLEIVVLRAPRRAEWQTETAVGGVIDRLRTLAVDERRAAAIAAGPPDPQEDGD